MQGDNVRAFVAAVQARYPPVAPASDAPTSASTITASTDTDGSASSSNNTIGGPSANPDNAGDKWEALKVTMDTVLASFTCYCVMMKEQDSNLGCMGDMIVM